MTWRDVFGDDVVVIDGGLSTQLERRGHRLDDPLWTGRVLTTDPSAIVQAHADFVGAGADVVISASYQVSREGFAAVGRSKAEADNALVSSVQAAREATGSTSCRVAASVGPYGAILHDGSEYRGRYGLSHQQLLDFHAQRLEVLVSAEPDLLAIETIPDADEAAALVDALREYPSVPAWLTFSASSDSQTCAGQSIEEAVSIAAESPAVIAVGVNCTDPVHVEGLVRRMSASVSLPVVVYPNAGGEWNAADGTWSGSVSGSAGAQLVDAWRRAGAVAIGGCCGTDAAEIARLANHLRG